MKVLDLFSGIGGFSLGLERAGMETAAFCEIDSFCREVLKKHWPDVPIHEDIRELKGGQIAADIICGGFPCQPFSCAGKRRGTEDDRHLWPEMLRVIKEVGPRWVIGENVAGLVSMGEQDSDVKVEGKTVTCTKESDTYSAVWSHEEKLHLFSIIEDLEAAGYDVAPSFVIPACGVDAHHRRDRIWIVAYSKHGRVSIGRRTETSCQESNLSQGIQRNEPSRIEKQTREVLSNHQGKDDGCCDIGEGRGQVQQFGECPCEGDVSDTRHTKSQRRNKEKKSGKRQTCSELTSCNSRRAAWPAEPSVGRVANGIPRRVDRLRSLGNAVVPQIPEMIGRAIMEIEGLARV